MPNSLPFSEDCRDALQEVSNVAMGVAGESLALLTDSFVQLSIPRIRYFQSGGLSEALVDLPADGLVSAVGSFWPLYENQSLDDIYALVVVTDQSFADLGRQMSRAASTDSDQAGLLKDIAATLIKSCLPELQEQLAQNVNKSLSLPVLDIQYLVRHQPVADCALPEPLSVEGFLSVEINYHLEAHAFNCDLVLLFPTSVLPTLQGQLETLLK